MYYSFPALDMAYAGTLSGMHSILSQVKIVTGKYPQYMFGDHLMVSPIVTPANSTTFLTEQTIWFPPGSWYDLEVCTFVA